MVLASIVVVWCPERPSMEDENFAINLGLLKILQPVRFLSLSGDEGRLLNCGDSPVFVPDPTTRYSLCLILCVTLYPASDHRSTILVTLRMSAFRACLKSEMEHWHSNAPEFTLFCLCAGLGIQANRIVYKDF